MTRFLKISFLFILNVLFFSTLFAREVEETFKKTVEVDNATRFKLENRNGGIEVRTWDKNEIEIIAHKKARADSKEEALEILERMEIIIEKRGDEIAVITEYPNRRRGNNGNNGFFGWLFGEHSWGVSYSVSYEVTVPENFDLDIESTNGKVEVIKCNGRMQLETTNGKINAHDVSGSVRCNTTNGSINVSFLKVTETDEMSFYSTNGSIKLYLPQDTGAEIKARTTNGHINCDMNITDHFERSKKRLDAEVNNGGVVIYLKTTNGSINIYEG